MLISVEEYREASGDTATSDAAVARSIRRVQTRIEGYLDRKLELQEHVENQFNVATPTLILRQWPVVLITSIDKDGTDIPLSDVKVQPNVGIIQHGNRLLWASDVEITYTAGYEHCPDDIRLVLVDLAQAHINGELDITGTLASRRVKRDTVYGVAAIEYDTNMVDSRQIEFYPELGPYVRILEKYKRPYEVPYL